MIVWLYDYAKVGHRQALFLKPSLPHLISAGVFCFHAILIFSKCASRMRVFMKIYFIKYFRILVCLPTFFLFTLTLSGCYPCYWNAGWHYPGGRCNEYQVYTPCGNYIKHFCDDLCEEECKFHGPACDMCWQCVSANECAVASQFQYCCKGTCCTM